MSLTCTLHSSPGVHFWLRYALSPRVNSVTEAYSYLGLCATVLIRLRRSFILTHLSSSRRPPDGDVFNGRVFSIPRDAKYIAKAANIVHPSLFAFQKVDRAQSYKRKDIVELFTTSTALWRSFCFLTVRTGKCDWANFNGEHKSVWNMEQLRFLPIVNLLPDKRQIYAKSINHYKGL